MRRCFYGSSVGLTDLALSPDGSRVYVIQAYATDIGPWGSVAVIDTSDNSLGSTTNSADT